MWLVINRTVRSNLIYYDQCKLHYLELRVVDDVGTCCVVINYDQNGVWIYTSTYILNIRDVPTNIIASKR